MTSLVYGTLRLELALDACLEPFLKRPNKLPLEVRDALRLGAYEILYRETPRRAAVNEWVEVVKRRSKKLSGLINAVLRKVDHCELPTATRYGVPDWLFVEWTDLFGAQRAEEVAKGMLKGEPLWLTSYHPQATHALIEEGCEVSLGKVDGTLAVRLSKPLAELSAYRRGWVQPQNPASTLPVRLLEAERGERVLDLASGNGIKAAQLAAAGARPLSIELHADKLKRAERNLARLGFEVEGLEFDLRGVPEVPPARKVLLDAPCTGTGTLRGNPELRTKVTSESITELATLQRELLATAAKLTAPGGILVYAVCALTYKEGQGMTEWFLANYPDFSAESFLFDLHAENTEAGSYILPLDGLDGFYIARFKRR